MVSTSVSCCPVVVVAFLSPPFIVLLFLANTFGRLYLSRLLRL